MPKTVDVPVELRDFNRLFEKLAYRHDHSQVFSDFLDLFMKQFSFDDCTELNERIQRQYPEKERTIFGSMIFEIIQVMDKMITDDNSWYDPFGTYYEVLASNYKKSGFGQFFTPQTVVDLMTMINGGESGELKGQGLRVNDCACGSGRMLLSFHVHHPGNYVFAQDIDLICCKMTVMNFLLHGCQGEVVWGDALNPTDFRGGWRLAPAPNGLCVMTYKIEKKESFIIGMWEQRKKEVDVKKQGSEVVQDVKKIINNFEKLAAVPQQLTLF